MSISGGKEKLAYIFETIYLLDILGDTIKYLIKI